MERRERPAANFTKTTKVTTVMTTVTSGDKRIDKYDYEKHQDGDYLLTKVNKTNVFLLFSYKCCLRIRTSIRDLHCLLGLVHFGLEKSLTLIHAMKKNKKISFFGKIQPEFDLNL